MATGWLNLRGCSREGKGSLLRSLCEEVLWRLDFLVKESEGSAMHLVAPPQPPAGQAAPWPPSQQPRLCIKSWGWMYTSEVPPTLAPPEPSLHANTWRPGLLFRALLWQPSAAQPWMTRCPVSVNDSPINRPVGQLLTRARLLPPTGPQTFLPGTRRPAGVTQGTSPPCQQDGPGPGLEPCPGMWPPRPSAKEALLGPGHWGAGRVREGLGPRWPG